jgi:hypothetical protein
MPECVIGADVSKRWIDVSVGGGKARRIEMESGALAGFAREAKACGALVVFEATGGYDAPLVTALAARRRQLVETRKQQLARLDPVADAAIRGSLVAHGERLGAGIARIEAAMRGAIRDDRDLAAAERPLRSAPGVGPVVAAALLTRQPEPGRSGRRGQAAPAGLAPLARDSGQRHGTRAIAGGRPELRALLYLAALTAIRLATRSSPPSAPGSSPPERPSDNRSSPAPTNCRDGSTPCSNQPSPAPHNPPHEHSCRVRPGTGLPRDSDGKVLRGKVEERVILFPILSGTVEFCAKCPLDAQIFASCLFSPPRKRGHFPPAAASSTQREHGRRRCGSWCLGLA